MQSDLLRTLDERGFIHQATDLAGLDDLCAKGPITAYIGFDLTADSLHVGSLIQIMVLRWMIRTGNNPLILMGEATTRIGDPTGKDKARPMLNSDEIENHRIGIQKVFDELVGTYAVESRRNPPRSLTNMQWFRGMDMLEYLRMYGPYFSINRMLTFDSVQERLSKQDSMSFLEFNYMLLQAIDFLRLHMRHGCVLQMGGSDQWGNIVNGVELVRRFGKKQVFGLTTPLMTNAAGEKMGKTAGGTVWLSPEKTSALDFFQFWRNVEDVKVEEFLKLFTELPLGKIADVMQGGINHAKKVLAFEVTKLVHGGPQALEAEKAAESLLSGNVVSEALPVVEISHAWLFEGGIGQGNVPQTVGALYVHADLAGSKNDAAKLAENRGIKLNGVITADVRRFVTPEDVVDGQIVLQKGKKTAVVLKVV